MAKTIAELTAAGAVNSDNDLLWIEQGGLPRKVSPGELGAGGVSINGVWNFSTTTTSADPGAGRIRFNNATPASVTAVYINDSTIGGFDSSTLLGLLGAGDFLYIQSATTAGDYIVFGITSKVDNTGWFTFNGTISDSGTLLTNDTDCGVLVRFGGGITDAASDTRTYARKDGAWVVIATEDVLVLSGGTQTTCNRFGSISIYDLKFDNDGKVYDKCSPAGFVQIDTTADWIRPVTDAADYQMRFTNQTGTGFSSGADTVNTWRSMATDFILTVSDNVAGGGGNSATFDIEVRFGTGPTLATATYTIAANRT